MNHPITSGQTYWVTLDNVRFKVKAIRPAALDGWWLCEGEATGDPLMAPTNVLTEVEDDQAS